MKRLSQAQWIWQRAQWPQFEWDEGQLAQVLGRARQAQGKVLGATRMLEERSAAQALSTVLVEEGVATSAIEGEVLEPSVVRSSVARRLGLPTAGLPPPDRNAEGLVDVLLDATRHYHSPLTLKRLLGWQASLFPSGYSGLQGIRTGALRGNRPMQVVSGPLGRERVHFVAPPRGRLASELKQFLSWFNLWPRGLDGLIRAGVAHLWFLTLHPFEDGNGRIARAMTDMALCQDERQGTRFFSPSAQILRRRDEYYQILERSQRGQLEVTAWLSWFLEQLEAAALAANQTIESILDKAHFWLRHHSKDFNERQRKVLNRLLDAGREGFEGGMNTRKYMGMTKTSRATAYRELAELVEKGCLVPLGQGRSSAYQIKW
jgi:Fic family protein